MLLYFMIQILTTNPTMKDFNNADTEISIFMNEIANLENLHQEFLTYRDNSTFISSEINTVIQTLHKLHCDMLRLKREPIHLFNYFNPCESVDLYKEKYKFTSLADIEVFTNKVFKFKETYDNLWAMLRNATCYDENKSEIIYSHFDNKHIIKIGQLNNLLKVKIYELIVTLDNFLGVVFSKNNFKFTEFPEKYKVIQRMILEAQLVVFDLRDAFRGLYHYIVKLKGLIK